jgi:CubicO group peptidase (beta-lactamase class C family)
MKTRDLFFAICLTVLVLASWWSATIVYADGLPRTQPEAVGFTSDRLARIPVVVQRELDNNMMPGAVIMLARDGQVFYEHVAGYRDLRDQTPMTADTLFRIRSMTKPLTGVAGMILVEEGKLRLTDSVSRFVPCFDDLKVLAAEEGSDTVPLQSKIQVRHLFSHTTGFAYTAPDGRRLHPSQFGTLQEFVDNLCTVDLYFQPGTNYRYSISNDVLGYVIERITGQRLGEFMTERIFAPLGMADTAFWVPDSELDRFSVTYDRSDSGLVEYDRPETSTHRDPEALHAGGGGLISTAEDYLRFAQMLANGGELNGVRTLSRHGVRLLSRNHLPTGIETDIPGQGYGLAIGVDVDLGRKGVMGNVGTIHWSGADNTHFWVDPVANIVGIWMTQARPFNFDYAHDLRNLTYQAFDGLLAGVAGQIP